MPSPRVNLLHEIARHCGGAIRIVDERTSWPALVELRSASGDFLVSIHVARVVFSKRGRDAAERRYENPAKGDPIVVLPGTTPLVLGLWTEVGVPVIVVHEAERRLGQRSRVSLFVALACLEAAVATGWAEHVSASGERIIAFPAALFAVFAETLVAGIIPETEQMRAALLAAEPSANDAQSIERARRATSALVRDAKFRRFVVAAYGGACAMCGLQLGIAEAAHILPASAPGSADVAVNGIALCPNHHAAFDRHLLVVDPATLRILQHPKLSSEGESFSALTREYLAAPTDTNLRPSESMLQARLEHFADQCSWSRR